LFLLGDVLTTFSLFTFCLPNPFLPLDLTARFDYMTLFSLDPLLALGAPPQPGQSAAPAWMQMVPLALIVVVFYFALIRPQQKKAKEQAEMLKGVRAGDKIITNGGIIATVVTVKDKSVSIRSADAKFEITKTAIAQITERSGEASPS
jgi:preprotein translocase subunit YajC